MSVLKGRAYTGEPAMYCISLHYQSPYKDGAVAQLAELLFPTQRVAGSSPVRATPLFFAFFLQPLH